MEMAKKVFGYSVALLIVLIASYVPAAEERAYRVTVARVVDGDTVQVFIDMDLDCRLETVRLADIDTPELRGRERRRALDAKMFLVNLIEGREVWLCVKLNRRGEIRRGRYRRIIGRILYQGRDVGQLLLAVGLAEPYGK